MDRASAQEIMMPIYSLQKFGKSLPRKAYGAEMMRINDRHIMSFV